MPVKCEALWTMLGHPGGPADVRGDDALPRFGADSRPRCSGRRRSCSRASTSSRWSGRRDPPAGRALDVPESRDRHALPPRRQALRQGPRRRSSTARASPASRTSSRSPTAPASGRRAFALAARAPEPVPRAWASIPSESGKVPHEATRHAARPRAARARGGDRRDRASTSTAITPRARTQERWFLAQLALADELGLPVVIHQRSALEDVMTILERVAPRRGRRAALLRPGRRAPAERARAHRLQARARRRAHVRPRGARRRGAGRARRHARARDRRALPRAGAALAPPQRTGAAAARRRRGCASCAAGRREQAKSITTRNARDLFRIPLG